MTPDPTTPAVDRPVFRGVGVALVTLFDDRGALLADDTAELAARLVNDGIAAVLVAGTTGEFWTLSGDERIAVTQAVRKAVPAPVPVLLNVGAATAAATLAVASLAAESTADAILCLVPPDAQPRELYPQVRGLVGALPLLAYHFPRAGFSPIPVEELADLVDGIKDSSGEAERLVRTPGLPAGVYTGSPLLLSLAGALGLDGALLALANVEPALAAAAFQGEATAQGRLAHLHRQASGDVPPRAVKQMTADRFGVAPFTRPLSLREAFSG